MGTSPRTGSVLSIVIQSIIQIKVYPRTSIDLSRRVRQLAHIVQGQIATICGKRLAKHMPAVVPPWLAGQYDMDKSVKKAAQESFNNTFATEEKKRAIWHVYQLPIADYTRDVVVKETVHTLSDERTTSPDEASGKYARVTGCSIIVLTELLGKWRPHDVLVIN